MPITLQMTDLRRVDPDVAKSALESLKSIASIVMGLALTNTIIALLTERDYSHIAPLHTISPWSAGASLAVVATIIRFYHGNNRLVDALYLPRSPSDEGPPGPIPRGGLGASFIVIFGQSVLFGVISFYADRTRELLLLLSILLIFDILWYFGTRMETKPSALRYQRRWVFNNVICGIAILVCYLAYALPEKQHILWLDGGIVALAVNTAVDFMISWELYFISSD